MNRAIEMLAIPMREREQINGFPGLCRLHRAEIKRVHGSWLEAEAEARKASDELQAFIPAAVGLAMYEIGLIRLRRTRAS